MKTESFILSVFPELEKPLACAEEQEATVSMAQIWIEFGSGGAQGEVEELEHKVAQVYAVLQNLLEGEPFSILRNILKGDGLEGWRKLARPSFPWTSLASLACPLPALPFLPPFLPFFPPFPPL